MNNMANSTALTDIKEELLGALINQKTVLLTAPPGAGKSTILPLWLLNRPEYQDKKIYLLQPRRVAAKNIACYLAQKIDEKVGKTIGYRLRNDICCSQHTRIEVITEGILIRLMQADPELLSCALIIFDEFHERSVQADLAFAIARDIQQGLRDDLTLLLISATIAVEQLQQQLPDACLFSVAGRQFPISYQYQPTINIRQWREHCLNVIQQQLHNINSSILVFLPGSADIRWLGQRLEAVMPKQVELYSLYGDLPLHKQQAAIKPTISGCYKVVLATNIAETSLTIDGVNLVIDAGFEKVAIYDAATLTNQLKQQTITKASAIQRAGRAGRQQAGQCIRLYSEDDFQRRPEQSIANIQQTDLLPVLIEAARWGVTELKRLPMLELPNSKKEQDAWHTLIALDIVNENKQLTAHGKQVAQLACHPRYAHMIIKAISLDKIEQSNYVILACLLAAFLEERDTFSPERAKNNANICHRLDELIKSPATNMAKTLQSRIVVQARQLYRQLTINQFIDESSLQNEELFLKVINTYLAGTLLAIAYPERIASSRHTNGDFLAANGKGLSLSIEDSLVSENYLVIAKTSQYQQHLTIRLAAPIDLNKLVELDLINFKTEQVLAYNSQNERIIAEQHKKLGAIVIEKKVEHEKITEQALINLWHTQIIENGLSWLNWQKSDRRLLSRLVWLNTYQPQLELINFDDESLLTQLDIWFSPFIGGIKTKVQLNKLNLSEMLLSLIDYPTLILVNKLAPEYFIGPTGRKCPINYTTEKAPKVSLPMQEAYGLISSPCVGNTSFGGEISMTLELLSPAGRPIQVTNDLASFWQGSYAQVQKEMKGRYPKHYWPDDPANAVATNKTKKYM